MGIFSGGECVAAQQSSPQSPTSVSWWEGWQAQPVGGGGTALQCVKTQSEIAEQRKKDGGRFSDETVGGGTLGGGSLSLPLQ